jgi:hypothetical protein
VFNPDEVGVSNWEDQKPKKVVVLITVRAHSVHHRISGNARHILIVICGSPGDAWLNPGYDYISGFQALHRGLEATGMQITKYLMLKHHHKPYVNVDLFGEDIRTVFLPHLAITRFMQGVCEEDSGLLTGDCSSHSCRC